MPLTVAERKHQMPFGAQRAVSIEQRVDAGYVSKVMNDELRPKTPSAQKKLRRVQNAIARKLGRRRDEVFGSGEAASEEHTAPLAASA